MREYGKVSSVFWTKGSGKRLRGDPEAQLVAFYLLTNPWCLSCGVYYLPLPVLSHETGIPIEGASKALRRVCEAGFAEYDLASEQVWVPNLPKIEIGESLSGGDKRKISLQAQLDRLDNHPFAQAFWDMYGAAFGLQKPKALGSPFDGPWEPLRCQEARSKKQETRSKKQEAHEPKRDRDLLQLECSETLLAPPSASASDKKKRRSPEQQERSVAVNRRYRERYEASEGHPPAGVDQQFNGIIAKFSDRYADDAMAILEWFFSSPDTVFKRSGWKPQVLLDQAPRLWRELHDKRRALENIAAPIQQRIAARNASLDIEAERANQILSEELFK